LAERSADWAATASLRACCVIARAAGGFVDGFLALQVFLGEARGAGGAGLRGHGAKQRVARIHHIAGAQRQQRLR
jgi:hypothetical protein